MLSGCTTSTSHYVAAKNTQDMGYRDHALSLDQWLISYSLRGIDTSQAYLYALRRAAEITQREGFDWFEVVSKTQDVQRVKEKPVVGMSAQRDYKQQTQCGLLVCRTTTEPSNTYGVNVGTDMHSKSRGGITESQLEIRMGKGISPEVANIYKPQDILTRTN